MSQVLRYPRLPALADLGTRHAVVEASAGTGKTYLLEHLVVDLLLRHGAKIEEILVVTFTERATSELCLRLRAKLTAMLHLRPDHPEVQAAAQHPDRDCWLIDDDARERLRAALLAFDRATISTIHGFCRGILADHAFLNSRLFDEQAVDEAGSFHGAFVEALRQDFAVDPSLRPYLSAWLQNGNTANLEATLLACARELARVFPPDLSALRPAFDEAALQAALAQWPRDLACDEALKPRLKSAGIKVQTAGAVIDRLNELARLIDQHGEDVVTFLVELPRLEAGWKKNRFEYLIENLSKSTSDPILGRLHAAVMAIEQARVPLLAALAPKFLPVIQARLLERKRVAGLYDFQDMLNLVAQRLADDSDSSRLLLSTLRRRYRHALIDEFQDTDDVQWFIFRRIFFESHDRHVLTVIGDPKQAIYRFRGADVHTYLRARREILDPGGTQVRLGRNFRSTPAVVEGCNAIFSEPTFFRAGTGIDYQQPVTCGCPGRDLRDLHDRSAPGVVVLDIGPEGKAGQIRSALRRQMVDEIRRMLSPEGALFVRDGEHRRQVHAGNVFVLAFTNHECREVGESLSQAGIPHAFFRQERLFATPEAADILDLLRALTEPLDPRLRARALLTRFFALDLPDLPLVNQPDLSSPALACLFAWQRLAERGDFEALFADIVARSGVACREVCLAASERGLTNILHVFEVLQEQAAATHADLRELVEMLGGFINGTRLPPGQDRDLQRLESDARAVQIMTVHASKGLEADVVFLYGGVERGPKHPPYVFHDQHGRRVLNLGRLSAQEETLLSQENEDEERRLLYVALTRARARLYLPRYPDDKTGIAASLGSVVDRVLANPSTRGLYQRVAVACPGEPPLRLPALEPAALAAWQPPSPPTPIPAEEFRQIARERAGFFITSYTGVKRHQGGFVVSEGPAETGSAPIDQQTTQPTQPGELARGRLSGIFLHAILEELPLDLAATMDAEAWLLHPTISSLLDRLARQHERDARQLAHAARMVHAALFAPLRLGSLVIPGLGRQRPFLRETEFLYPIPEKSHPLLGLAQDHRPWTIERGLIKGFIDAVFEHEGRVYLCDWKGDWLPSWAPSHLDLHCRNNYDVQARLYTLALLRMANVRNRTTFDQRFGGVLYCFLRGLRADAPDAGIMFRRPEWETVLAWQDEMLGGEFWGLS